MKQNMGMAGLKTYQANEKKVLAFEDLDTSLTYSYANYLNWLFEDRVELFKGKVFKMSPAPSPLHQQVSAAISYSLYHYLKNKSCKVYTAPFDVRFPQESKADENIDTVLQPDFA